MPQPVQPISISSGEPSAGGDGNKKTHPLPVANGRRQSSAEDFGLLYEADGEGEGECEGGEEQRDMCDLVPSPMEQPRYSAAPPTPSPRSRKLTSEVVPSSSSRFREAAGGAGAEVDDDDGGGGEVDGEMEFTAWASPPHSQESQSSRDADADAGDGGQGAQHPHAAVPQVASSGGGPSNVEADLPAAHQTNTEPRAMATATANASLQPPREHGLPPPPPVDPQQDPPEEIKSTIYTFSSTLTGRMLTKISSTFLRADRISTHSGSALAGFLSLLLVTCANYVLSPMRDAAALAVGVNHIPHLTLASTVLALASSVPVGWLFEAPNPERGGLSWRRRVGLTRGETQGTSLALFYRVFAISLVGYAAGFKVVELLSGGSSGEAAAAEVAVDGAAAVPEEEGLGLLADVLAWPPSPAALMSLPLASIPLLLRTLLSLLRAVLSRVVRSKFGKLFYVAFFLVVHLMKLHSLSLIWGVASEAMEYEERAEKREKKRREEREREAAAKAAEEAAACSESRDRLNPLPPALTSPPTKMTTATTAVMQEEKKEDPASSTAMAQQREGLRRRKKHAPKLSSIPSGEAIGGGRPQEVTDGEEGGGSGDEAGEADNEPREGQCIAKDRQEKGALSEGASSKLPPRSDSSSSNKSNKNGGKNDANCTDGGLNPAKTRSRLRRLAFVGLGGTIGGILGSVLASAAAGTLHLSGLLIVAAVLLELSAELSVELGRIMLRHWEEEQLALLEEMARDQKRKTRHRQKGGRGQSPGGKDGEDDEFDSSMKRVRSLGSMKRVASGGSLMNRSSGGAKDSSGGVSGGGKAKASSASSSKAPVSRMRKAQSAITLSAMAAAEVASKQKQQQQTPTEKCGKASSDAAKGGGKPSTPPRSQSSSASSSSKTTSAAPVAVSRSALDDSNSFKQRLLRGVTTILRSRLLMCIFTYNALAATTTVLLSFQRAELVANRSASGDAPSTEKDTAFLARINMASSVAVFALQASGAGALMSDYCGRYGTLALMPVVRLCGVAGLAWWHVKGSGRPPNLTLFLVLDEFAKVMNFAVAKPVRESLWRGLSNEARYEAKPIVDTLANRWGGGSAAFLTSFFGAALEFTGWGRVSDVDGSRTVFGFPPVLILCAIAAVWWAVVSLDLGNIRRRIDIELKKHQ